MEWRSYYIERAAWARDMAQRARGVEERREWEVLAEIYDARASEPLADESVH